MAHRDRTPKLLTAEHLYAISDPFYKFELEAGRLRVMEPPGFAHGDVTVALSAALARHVRLHRLGKVVTETGFVLHRKPDRVYGPDVAFVRADRLPRADRAHLYFEGAPDLAVEVRSPNDRPDEVTEKVRGYLDAHTPLVWVVDPQARTVVVHPLDADPRGLGVGDILEGGHVVPGFALPLAELFDDAQPPG
jgi:Uma2 family endonuclease